MLPTLALAVALAAPVPKAPPFPLRTDPLPDEYKLIDLADAALPRSEKGTVSLLAWETVEDDRPHTYTHALLFKKFDKADAKGNNCALCMLYRHPKDTEWQFRFINPPPIPKGGKMPEASDAFWFGSQSYAKLPTDKELAAFLKDVDWTPKLGSEVAHFLDGKRVITTKLAGGGFDPAAWKNAFDRDPPVDLFPELKVKTEK
jgi:hypothetical protein